METNSTTTTPSSSSPIVDLQIVGAGLAGLLAANLAADAGLTVRLIERRTSPGGRAASAGNDGYTLNVGPHALYLQGEARRILTDLGLDPAGTAPETAGGTGAIDGRVGLLPIGPTSLARTSLLSPMAKLDTARLLARIPRVDPAELADVTVRDWIDDATGRPDARVLIDGIVNLSTYNAAAELASADAAVAQLQIALDQGVHYVHDGWGSIVAGLSARATAKGVHRVEATIGRVAGAGAAGSATDQATLAATTDGDAYLAGATLIAAGGPAVADRLLGLGVDQDGTSNVGRAGPPVEAAVLDLGLRSRPPVGAHLGLDQRLYATVHSVAPGLAPAGRHLVSLACYRLPGEDRSPEETKEALLGHGRQMGIDLDDVEMQRYLHRLTVAYGMPMAERGGLTGRPTVQVDNRDGVFVAGDWVGPRGLLADAAAASAEDAVAAVVLRRGAVETASRGLDQRATLVRR